MQNQCHAAFREGMARRTGLVVQRLSGIASLITLSIVAVRVPDRYMSAARRAWESSGGHHLAQPGPHTGDSPGAESRR